MSDLRSEIKFGTDGWRGIIADDFTFSSGTPDLCKIAHERFETYMQRVLPGARLVQIDPSDPIFDGFFKINPADMLTCARGPGDIRGIYQDNDPHKRLLVVANFTKSLAHRWRWSGGLGSGLGDGEGGLVSTAYKLGLNYFIYGLSH